MDHLTVEIGQTKRNSDFIIFCELKYNHKRINKDGTRSWSCREAKFSATIITSESVVSKINNHMYDEDAEDVLQGRIGEVVGDCHVHPKNMDDVQFAIHRALANMKIRSTEENLSAGEIYRQEQRKLIQSLGSEVEASSLPTYRSVQTRLYNSKHQKVSTYPQIYSRFHDRR